MEISKKEKLHILVNPRGGKRREPSRVRPPNTRIEEATWAPVEANVQYYRVCEKKIPPPPERYPISRRAVHMKWERRTNNKREISPLSLSLAGLVQAQCLSDAFYVECKVCIKA